MKNPCTPDCDRRNSTCHAKCPDYRKYEKEQREKRDKKNMQQDIDSFLDTRKVKRAQKRNAKTRKNVDYDKWN